MSINHRTEAADCSNDDHKVTIEMCQDLDKADKLLAFREKFRLPDNLIYLDGNSLGPLPKATPGRIVEVVTISRDPCHNAVHESSSSKASTDQPPHAMGPC